MSRKFNGHLALISLGLLAGTAPVEAVVTTQDAAPAISPAARWLQLAIETTPKTTPPPKIKKIDLPRQKTLPKQGAAAEPPKTVPKQGAPAGPSKKTDLTPPDPNKKPVDQTNNVKLVEVKDPKFGTLKVTPEAKAAYLALPASARAQLSDPKGGALVSAAALQRLADHYRGFKPPNVPAGVPCGPPGSVGSDFISDGHGGCTFASAQIW
jgi:hypothetical protein